MGKDFKIWGFGYGLLGDLVASLPLLTYFEKKYPDSYKIFVIEKNCSHALEMFINHPLIDKIKITDNWKGVGEEDRKIASACDIRDASWQDTTKDRCGRFAKGQWHNPIFWYNEYTFVEAIARLFGVEDIRDVLTEEEMYPKLHKWFDVGWDKTKQTSGYKTPRNTETGIISKNIAIWPFAGYGKTFGRSPSSKWWIKLVDKLINMGYNIHHFGLDKVVMSDNEAYTKCTDLTFFQQMKLSLASEVTIGCESGPMWFTGAYSHPAIHLMTNYLRGHKTNLLACDPVNRNADTLFNKQMCDNIDHDKVIELIERKTS